MQIVIAVLLLAGNAFFVAIEFAVTRARPTMVSELVSRGVGGARSLQHAVRHIDAYLSACQLGITVCSIGLGITAEPVVSHAFEALFGEGTIWGVSAAAVGFVLSYTLVSTAHVVLGELAPKSLAIARTERTGLALAPPMRLFYLVTKPVVDTLNWMGNAVLKPFGIPPASEAGHAPHTERELRTLIEQSEREGILDPEERTFTEGVFSFGDRRAREVMVPRRQVQVLRSDQPVEEAARVAVGSGHNRLPLCDETGNLDSATQMVHTLSLLGALVGDRRPELSELAGPLLRTSEDVLLDELLADMRDRRQHMALLADEYGTAVGIVTLEDVLEQIVGDIRDEYDPAPGQSVELRPDGTVRVSGEARLEAVGKELDLDVGGHREATFGGYLVGLSGRVPDRGEVLDLGRWQATIDERDDSSIASVTLRPAERPAPTPGPGAAWLQRPFWLPIPSDSLSLLGDICSCTSSTYSCGSLSLVSRSRASAWSALNLRNWWPRSTRRLSGALRRKSGRASSSSSAM
ncbi:MAG: hemolysin family protein [Pseudonocardiales bacterium]